MVIIQNTDEVAICIRCHTEIHNLPWFSSSIDWICKKCSNKTIAGPVKPIGYKRKLAKKK